MKNKFLDELVELAFKNVSISIINFKSRAVEFIINYEYDTPPCNKKGWERVCYCFLKRFVPKRWIEEERKFSMNEYYLTKFKSAP